MAYNDPYNYVLLSKQVASNSASISFTSLINSNFTNYLIRLRSVIPATNNAFIEMLFSTNNGSTYLSTGYKYAWYLINTSVQNIGGTDAASFILISDSQSNIAASFLNTDIYLFDLNSSTICPKAYCQSIMSTGTGSCEYFISGGMNTTLLGVNAIQLFYNSGNISSGTFSLYGVKES